MNDALRARRIEAVSVNVRHHIMPNLFFPRCDHIVIDGAYMRGQLVHLRLRDGQAQIVLRPRQRNPEPAPRLVAHIRGEQVQHGLRRVARSQRAFIRWFHGGSF